MRGSMTLANATVPESAMRLVVEKLEKRQSFNPGFVNTLLIGSGVEPEDAPRAAEALVKKLKRFGFLAEAPGGKLYVAAQ